MKEIFRVCGDRLNNYTERDGWPTEAIPAFDFQAKMQKLVKDDIRYAFLSTLLPKDESRYSTGEWSVFYTADSPTTAIYEVAYHYRKGLIGKSHGVRYKSASKIIYKIRADFFNQKSVPDDGKYTDPDNYHECQIFARQAVSDGCCSLIAKSARHRDGICYPIFLDSILSALPSLEHKFTLRWYCAEDRISHFAEGRERDVELLAV